MTAATTSPDTTRRRPGSFMRWMRKVGWRHLVALAAVAFALFPVVWIASASINPTSSLQGQQLIPDDPTLANYRTLFEGDPNVPFGRWFVNTLVIAGTATIVNTLLCAMSAYAFSRLRFRGRRTGLLSILLVQMFPQILAIVALFAIMQNLGRVFPAIGLGTQAGLVLIYLGGALGVNTWLMKGFFDSIPRSLDEAAKIDGASHFQIFRIVILPLAAPVLAVVALLTFILLINDFLIASVMLNDVEEYTLAVGLYRFIDGRYGANWGPFAAGALLAAIPVIVLFQFLQRYIVSGLTQGAVKE
jgi:arabinogalactan oligomer/maltooligosaccharide transport system permease protein